MADTTASNSNAQNVGSMTIPDQYAPDPNNKEAFNEWCLQWCRWGAGRWNPMLAPLQQGVGDEDANQILPMGWAENVMLNTTYWLGKQYGNPFMWMFRDLFNNWIPARIIPGSDIYVKLRHIQGNLTKQYQNLDETVYVKGYSNEVLEDMQSEINLGKWKLEYDEAFAMLEEMNLMFTAFGQQRIENPAQLVKLEETAQEGMEEIFTWSVRDFLHRTHFREWLNKSAEYTMPSWFCRAKIEIDDNREIKISLPRPFQCIWDNKEDNALGRDSTYSGEFDMPTATEVISYYKSIGEPFTETEEKEIIALANVGYYGDITAQKLNTGYVNKFTWWTGFNASNAPKTVTKLCFRWQALDKNKRLQWYYAEVIGGKYVKQAKLLPYQSEDRENPKKTHCNVVDFRPDVIYGISVGLVERMRRLQERKDMLEAKGDEWINKTLGQVAIFDSSRFGTAGNKLHDILSELKQNSATAVNGANIDDPNLVRVAKLFENGRIGFTPEDLQMLQIRIDALDRQMQLIASTPEAVLGQPQGEIGKGVFEQTVAQSTYGLLPFYDGRAAWVTEILQRVVDMYRMLYTQDEEKKRLRISPRQYRLVQYSKKWSNADLALYVKQSDAIDEKDMQFLKDFLFNLSQNAQATGVTFADAARALTITTKTELINYYEAQQRKLEQKQMMQEAQQIAVENERLKAQIQSQNEQTAMRERGQTERKAMEIEGKQDTAILEAELAPESAPA